MSLNGQHILVTGASRGIGFAISEELLSQGARVSLHYNSGEGEVKSLAQKYSDASTHLIRADFEDMDSVRHLFQQAMQDAGVIDTLVLNAGVFLPHEPAMDTDTWWKIWKKTLTINLDACGMLTKLALDHFMETGGGRQGQA